MKLPQYSELVHPMCRKIDIVFCHLVGSLQKAMKFQSKFKTYILKASWRPSTRICWGCTAIHTLLLSTERRSLSGYHQNKYWVFNRIFPYWSSLFIYKHCQICFVQYNQNWEWDIIWGNGRFLKGVFFSVWVFFQTFTNHRTAWEKRRTFL